MEKLTKEEFEYLQKFEPQMNTATKSDYMRGIPKADIEKIGTEWGWKPQIGLEEGLKKCVEAMK